MLLHAAAGWVSRARIGIPCRDCALLIRQSSCGRSGRETISWAHRISRAATYPGQQAGGNGGSSGSLAELALLCLAHHGLGPERNKKRDR
jgi:hypothetical protein